MKQCKSSYLKYNRCQLDEGHPGVHQSGIVTWRPRVQLQRAIRRTESPKHPVKLIEIECPECFRVQYGELGMIDHLVYGERWTRDAATRFTAVRISLPPKRIK